MHVCFYQRERQAGRGGGGQRGSERDICKHACMQACIHTSARTHAYSQVRKTVAGWINLGVDVTWLSSKVQSALRAIYCMCITIVQYLDVTWLWCKATQARRELHGGVLSLQKTFLEWNRTQHLPAVVEAAGAFFKNQVFCHSAECVLTRPKRTASSCSPACAMLSTLRLRLVWNTPGVRKVGQCHTVAAVHLRRTTGGRRHWGGFR